MSEKGNDDKGLRVWIWILGSLLIIGFLFVLAYVIFPIMTE